MADIDPSPEGFRALLEDDEPSFEDILACVFNLQPHEVRTYETLLDHPGSTVAELAAVLERDRSNVNRSLNALCDQGLVERRRRLLENGGDVYQYEATSRPAVRELLHEALEAWSAYVHERIDEFGE